MQLLTIELIPKTTFNTNVRSIVPRSTWDRIRAAVYRAADRRCEICGGVGKQHPVECHEVWDYSAPPTQRLAKFMAVCPSCHEVLHYGLAEVHGNAECALRHLMKVNNWEENVARQHIAEAFAIWDARSRREWKLDLGNTVESVIKERK